MAEMFSYEEVPYLQDILNYLPIEAIDKEDVSAYIQNVISLISVNYKYEQYQFSYFGMHLLYMTYIYSTVWKINKISPKRYADAVIFARAYNNRDLDFFNIESIFQYSLVPEKELPRIFKIIDLDDSQIKNVAGLVDIRNDIAHASGKFEILTDNDFSVRTNTIYRSINNIHARMDTQIRAWFRDILLKYCKGEFDEYSEVNDIVYEQMVQAFNLSVAELLVCNKMSVRHLITENREFADKLKSFKRDLRKYCDNKGYLG